MATTTNFTFTNNTESARQTTTYDLGLLTNYGQQWLQDGSMLYSNVTAPTNQKELIYYKSTSIPTVTNNLKLGKAPSAKGGVHYGIRLESTIVTTSTDQGCGCVTFEDPIVGNLMIRHPNSNYITEDLVVEFLGRMLSALLYKDSTAATPQTRIQSLMRGLLQVTSE